MQYLLVTNETSSAIESGIQCKLPEKGCSGMNLSIEYNRERILEKLEKRAKSTRKR